MTPTALHTADLAWRDIHDPQIDARQQRDGSYLVWLYRHRSMSVCVGSAHSWDEAKNIVRSALATLHTRANARIHDLSVTLSTAHPTRPSTTPPWRTTCVRAGRRCEYMRDVGFIPSSWRSNGPQGTHDRARRYAR